MSAFAAIVEGHGEIESLPILVRRISSELCTGNTLNLPKANVLRILRSRLVRTGELEKAVQAAAIKIGQVGNILILIDSDDDDPAILLTNLNLRAKSSAPHINVNVIVAVREFEAWIIHSISSLAGKRGLPTNILPPVFPESIRGAKEWIARQMENNSYSETIDCPAFTAQMDLTLCMGSESFQDLHRVLNSIGE